MAEQHQTPLILVDGSSYLHRAYHALPPLTNSKGQQTGAVFGVMNMLRKLIKTYRPTHIAVVFDAKGKTFRHKLYPEYKANRPPMPDDLKSQIKPLFDLIHALGLPLLSIEGVEADDVIGTLAARAQKESLDVLISTCDKDFAQLVNEHVSLINTMTNTTLDPQGVEEKFGIPPELIIDYLTLVGDSSDNVPGVEKVGPKTAVKWLKQYGSLDNLIQHADEISGKVGENLRHALSQIPLSKKLVTIDNNVALSMQTKDLIDQPDNDTELVSILKQLEFKSWIDELENPITGNEQPVQRQYQTILEKADFEALLKRLSEASLFAIDTETTSLNYMDAQIVGLSFSFKEGEAFYLPLAHDYENAPKQIAREEALSKLKPILESSSHQKVGQNLKYDKEVLLNHGVELRGIAFDTMLEAYVLNNTETRYDLDTLANQYLKEKTISFEEVAGTGAKQKTFNQISLEEAGPYAAEDADISYRLHQRLWPQLQSIKKAGDVLRDIEMPLIDVLVAMERHGVLVDADLLAQQSQELAKRLDQLEQEVYGIAGEAFNLSSPKQLQHVLYEKLQLPPIKKTPSGQLSTNESVLQELALDYPLPKLILEYRSLNKLKSTYTDRLPEQINARTGRVHTSYHQAITSTGRLSSTDPNLQNIPARTEEGRRIRQAFIAPDHYKLLAADYSQVELHIMAHLSQDPGLLKAFQNNQDVHAATASEIFNTPLENVTSTQRREAKAINFGLIYGMSAFGLSKQIGVDRATAQSYIDTYFNRYPKVHEYMESIRAFARDRGYVETLHGRRLLTPNIRSNNVHLRNAAERAAINAPMQGTAAEIIKLAMIRIHAWLMESGIDVHMIMQVHDELVFEVHESVIDEAKERIANFMNHAANLSAPLKVDIEIGKNWNL